MGAEAGEEPAEDKDARWTKKHGKSFFGYKNLATGKAQERGTGMTL